MVQNAEQPPSVDERQWEASLRNLSERFPEASSERVAKVLRDHNGHAGQASVALRKSISSVVLEPDPEDAEHVATILSSSTIFKHTCKTQFREFDKNRDGVLDWDETVALTGELYQDFGLQQPSHGSLRAFYDAFDENGDGVLSEREFRKFFEKYLRHAYFDVAKLRKIVESKSSSGGGGVKSAPRTPTSSRVEAPRTSTPNSFRLEASRAPSRASSASGIDAPREAQRTPSRTQSRAASRRSSVAEDDAKAPWSPSKSRLLLLETSPSSAGGGGRSSPALLLGRSR